MRRNACAVFGCALFVAVFAAGCRASSQPSAGPTTRTTTSAGPTAHPSTTAPARVTSPTGVDRIVTPEVRVGLVRAFAAGRLVSRAYVAGVEPGSVRYAYDARDGREWALADFRPSAAARAVHERLQGAAADPLIAFQDGPMVFSRVPASAWVFVSDTGGLVCPPRPPASLLEHWSIDTVDCRH